MHGRASVREGLAGLKGSSGGASGWGGAGSGSAVAGAEAACLPGRLAFLSLFLFGMIES